jgi:hypothetical protein
LPPQPQSVTSIQFIQAGSDAHLTPTDVAGFDAVANWNPVQTGADYDSQVAPGAATQITWVASSGLVDSTGTSSTVGYSVTSYGYLSTGNKAVPGPNGNLLAGGAMTSGTAGAAPLPVGVTVSGLNPGDAYKILVYTFGGPNELTYGSVALTGGSTYYFQSAEGDGVGGMLKDLENHSSAVNLFASAPAGDPIPNPQTLKSNFIEFDGVTGSNAATLTLTELGAWPNGTWAPAPAAGSSAVLGIAGFQVLDMGKAAPAPTSTPKPTETPLAQ